MLLDLPVLYTHAKLDVAYSVTPTVKYRGDVHLTVTGSYTMLGIVINTKIWNVFSTVR